MGHLLQHCTNTTLIDAAWSKLERRWDNMSVATTEKYLLMLITHGREDKIQQFMARGFTPYRGIFKNMYLHVWDDDEYQMYVQCAKFDPIHVFRRILQTQQYKLLKYFVQSYNLMYLAYAVLTCDDVGPYFHEIYGTIMEICESKVSTVSMGDFSLLLTRWITGENSSPRQLIDVPFTVANAEFWIKNTDLFEDYSKEDFTNCIRNALVHVIHNEKLYRAMRKMFTELRKKAPTEAQARAKRKAAEQATEAAEQASKTDKATESDRATEQATESIESTGQLSE